MTIMLAEIMDAPEFGEIMFLVGFILFVIEVRANHRRLS